jgi:phosphoglycolate phosphatase-like HAD superfamily hydrolase
MTLLLFDIDGTLVNAFGTGRAALETAFEDVTGRPIDSDGLPFSGKTDPQIVREMLAQDAAGGDHEALAPRILDRYAARLAETLPQQHVEALPGIRALLEQLSERDDVLLALLTGNLERTASLKLRAVKLDDFFPFGAFSSDDADRDRLVPFAARRAEERAGRPFSGEDIVVIGDTPRDVACGDAHGTRTVGVCTGHYDRAALEETGADLVFDDLTEADRVVSAIVEAK